MDADKKAQIQAHAQEMVALLYEETDLEQVKTLAGIEEAVRKHVLKYGATIVLAQPTITLPTPNFPS
ncbi:MAG: hypothetical protein WCA35_03460 [Kovacikia sp.]